jgi:hypothetical protein
MQSFDGKLYNLGLNLIVALTGVQNAVAAATAATSRRLMVDSGGVVDSASLWLFERWFAEALA